MMNDTDSLTAFSDTWCPYCSTPPTNYVYHGGTKCPKLTEHANEHQDMFDGIKFQNLPSITLNLPQPPPQPNNEPIVWDLVIQDMRDREEKGVQKYHTHLQPFNGRDALIDAYQEALDLVVYLRQLIYEKEKHDFLVGHP